MSECILMLLFGSFIQVTKFNIILVRRSSVVQRLPCDFVPSACRFGGRREKADVKFSTCFE